MVRPKKKPINSRKHWTKEDIEFLLEHYGERKNSYIARKLGKSEEAIGHKVAEIFGNQRKEEYLGLYGTKDVATALGVDTTTVAKWIEKLELPFEKIKIEKYNNGKADVDFKRGFIAEELWDWLYSNRERIALNPKKVQLGIIPEPKWFIDTIEKGTWYCIQMRWTKEEEEKLIHLYYKEDRPIKEIAEILGRTEHSIRRKLQRYNERLKQRKIVS